MTRMNGPAELLTVDALGNALPGPMYDDCGPAAWWADEEGTARMAWRHTFYARDDNGQALPETAVQFYVPDWLCVGAWPSLAALRAIEGRMGWRRSCGARSPGPVRRAE